MSANPDTVRMLYDAFKVGDVATFLGAANVLDAVVRQDFLEVGPVQVPAILSVYGGSAVVGAQKTARREGGISCKR